MSHEEQFLASLPSQATGDIANNAVEGLGRRIIEIYDYLSALEEVLKRLQDRVAEGEIKEILGDLGTLKEDLTKMVIDVYGECRMTALEDFDEPTFDATRRFKRANDPHESAFQCHQTLRPRTQIRLGSGRYATREAERCM
ncbi:hypothetical protein M413DRAFT_30003 [Hebeloma cylindrosporum]|uniref:Uncharacterized protein n=1 Tax=Hebeloma cylindrosporum TaxID=76867 RepID=A0A0C2YBR5_HEBCY|nr:hypothetical protein M413DRAFT_30003 [Hebeloma cylindrosporum h7]